MDCGLQRFCLYRLQEGSANIHGPLFRQSTSHNKNTICPESKADEDSESEELQRLCAVREVVQGVTNSNKTNQNQRIRSFLLPQGQ